MRRREFLAQFDEMDLSRWARQERDDDERESRMLSVGGKIKQLAGLAHTADLTNEQSEFVERMVGITGNGARTSHLSEPQVDYIEGLHERHFGRAQG